MTPVIARTAKSGNFPQPARRYVRMGGQTR